MEMIRIVWTVFVLSSVYSLPVVQISTCDAPVANLSLSICCFTEILPAGELVIFFNNSIPVAGISQSCVLLHDNQEVTSSCSMRDNVSVYGIVFPGQNFASDGGHNTWSCGFHGFKAEMTITVLDSHKYIKQSPGSTAMLQYVLNDTASLNGSIRVYSLQQKHTVLKVDLNNTVIFEENRIDYIGNVKRKNFSLQIESISTEDRGTYICQYRIETIPNIFRHAITLLVPEKPPKPTVINVNKGNEVERVMSAELACTANSGYAAPLFYIPQLETRWIYQPYDTSSYTILTNGSTAYISAVNCTRETLPAVKCYVENDVGRSEDSEEFSPHSLCFDDSYQPAGSDDYYQPAGPDESNQLTGSDDTKILFVFLGVVVFCVVLPLAIGTGIYIRRRQVCLQCVRSCNIYRRNSNSDRDVRRSECDSRRILFDDIVENPWRRLRDDMPALADGLRDHRPQSLEMEQTLERIATEESRLNYERQYNRVRDYRPHSLEMQQALERIAMEESRLNNERQYNRGTFRSDDSSRTHAGESSSGRAVGGDSAASTGAVRRIDLGQRGATRPLSDDISVLREVETLIQRHHDSLGRNVIRLQISRDRIVENVLAYYTEENLALARVTVKMVGEDGRDCGGVTLDMYTTFWSRVQEQFFIGCERVVPELQAHRYAEEAKFRVLGRILSHSIAVMKTFPIKMCKSTIIAMIYDTTEVAADTLLEDFLYFLDDHERTLVTSAINHYSSLTTGQVEELAGVFERFNYGAIPTEDTFKHHVTQLARHVTCIRPRTLLELMRSGIPQPHFEHFWSRFHINTLDVLFKVLRPTADRVIARLKAVGGYRDMTRCQTLVLEFLKDLLHEMSQPELETFLHFVTGKKSIPRENITIQFTTETGAMRVPKAHTCSSMLELPETYENYSTFRSELKHILASEEALTMTMA